MPRPVTIEDERPIVTNRPKNEGPGSDHRSRGLFPPPADICLNRFRSLNEREKARERIQQERVSRRRFDNHGSRIRRSDARNRRVVPSSL